MLMKSLVGQIHQRTLIINGEADPLFPPQHGKLLIETFVSGQFHLIEGMVHVIQPFFYEVCWQAIQDHLF
jgi:pimeloyl-ACP methyl ester carboxylesterase